MAAAIYETPWYNLNPRLRKDLAFILMRFQKPATAKSSFFKVNMESLADVSFYTMVP
jgi:hypothetical protein